MLNSESSAADQLGTDVHVIDTDLLLHFVVDNWTTIVILLIDRLHFEV